MLSKKIHNKCQGSPSTISKSSSISSRNAAGFTPWNPLWNLARARGQRPIPQGRPKAYSTGFTLLEMLVSVSIFTIVMTISTGAILTLNDSLQKAKLMRAAIENVSFTLEGMAKKIRTGTDIRCGSVASTLDVELSLLTYPKDCSGGGKRITFYYAEQSQYIGYQLNNNSIQIDVRPFGIESISSLTDSDVSITNMTFYVTGACPQTVDSFNTNCPNPDLNQPMVKIILTGEAKLPGKSKLDTTFNIETTVSTRLLDK